MALEITLWAIGGAIAGFLLVALFDPHGMLTHLDSTSAVTGALLAIGLNRLVRR